MSLRSTASFCAYLRVTLLGFLRLRWLLMRLRRIILPVPVIWMRALAPLCVLSFGIG